MSFTHDTELSLQAAVALVNSAVDADTMTTIDEADAFWSTWDYTGRRDRTGAELQAVRELRPVLRTLLTSERDRTVELVNAHLADARALPQLVRHDEWDWHLHATSPEQPWATRILVETAMAMIDVIRGDELSRMGICADTDCEGLVLDLSRNRSRRFCSTACTNRAAVAAYRARRADTP
ncbi:RNA-binding protein [Nocardioides sp. JQ2195]|uniref:CGNR zinc finger domain-containing protein n=1 Tax=Nocardioides sp. JQ2195 TaxID=2592334 RepID=UPI00143ED019|nr:CGNR zinc finger domain-containing protein [Nocardioides sp. JQ2195]QIX27411.1 RNA-binding protein [Nocardioides sp. JQ2195]